MVDAHRDRAGTSTHLREAPWVPGKGRGVSRARARLGACA